MKTHVHYIDNLIKGQLNTNNVLNARILDAFDSVSREHFLPESFRGAAYVDRLISLGDSGAMQEPLVTARMLELAAIKEHETVIVIDDATGYTSALASLLADQVICVVHEKETSKRVRTNLSTLDRENITLLQGDAIDQLKQHFVDVIIIDGGVQAKIEPILSHLLNAGRLVTIAQDNTRPGSNCGQGIIVRYSRINDTFAKTYHNEAATQLLPHFTKQPTFSL
jgi:protein-L-isoaspartate(D-aspartate) O-methyltransferase